MKRFLTGLLSIVVILTFFGCRKDPSEAFPNLVSNFEKEFETTPPPLPADVSIRYLIHNYSGGAVFPVGYNGGIQPQSSTASVSNPSQPATSSTHSSSVLGSTSPSGSNLQPTSLSTSGVCSDIQEAKDVVLVYLKAVTEIFSVTINSKNDY